MTGNANMDAVLKEGREAFSRAKYRQAWERFSEAAHLDPENPVVRFWLGASEYHLGNHRLAIRNLAFLCCNPNFALVHLTIAFFDQLSQSLFECLWWVFRCDFADKMFL